MDLDVCSIREWLGFNSVSLVLHGIMMYQLVCGLLSLSGS